jgi:hypothetical protein
MDAAARRAIVDELGAAFGGAQDVSPDATQPLHVLLPNLKLLAPWTSSTRALVRFGGWPGTRPDFWVDIEVRNAHQQPPRSSSQEYILGEPWLRYSFNLPWNGEDTATRAVQLWLGRFRESG